MCITPSCRAVHSALALLQNHQEERNNPLLEVLPLSSLSRKRGRAFLPQFPCVKVDFRLSSMLGRCMCDAFCPCSLRSERRSAFLHVLGILGQRSALVSAISLLGFGGLDHASGASPRSPCSRAPAPRARQGVHSALALLRACDFGGLFALFEGLPGH